MERKPTCIICPLGCELTVQTEDKKVLDVKGNTCPRGERYAVKEVTAPERTLTTIMCASDGQMVPVKTDRPVPYDKLFDCMRAVNEKTLVFHKYCRIIFNHPSHCKKQSSNQCWNENK